MYNDPTKPDEREGKLPRWAQDTITGLRRKVKDARASAEEARLATHPDESDTVISRFQEDPIGLGNGSRITFRLGSQWRDTITVWAEPSRGRIVIMGDRMIAVRPNTGNAVDISLAD